MADKELTLEEVIARNNRQRKTIEELTQGSKVLAARINELEIWERFARYLINECVDQVITASNLEAALSTMLEGEKKGKKS